jgi:hypothetical protein
MSLKFQPKTEDELSQFENLPEGDYPFTVLESSIEISKSAKNSGKQMVKLKLNVHGKEYDRHVYDYFADWFSEWKLKHFCETAGLGASYLSGELDPSNDNWKGREGFVRIGIEAGKGNFKDKNTVEDYLPKESQKVESVKSTTTKQAKPVTPSSPGASDMEQDDVPF